MNSLLYLHIFYDEINLKFGKKKKVQETEIIVKLNLEDMDSG